MVVVVVAEEVAVVLGPLFVEPFVLAAMSVPKPPTTRTTPPHRALRYSRQHG